MDSIYMPCTLTRKVTIPISMVDPHLESTLLSTIVKELAGKCMPEGFVDPDTIVLVTYTCGTVNGNMVSFTCVFNCNVANPVEGHILLCIVENNTKAGLKCRLDIQGKSPCVVFVARDHHNIDDEINKKVVGEKITVKVIGQRFELYDKFISIIGSLILVEHDEPEEGEPDDAEPDDVEPVEGEQEEEPDDEPEEEPDDEPDEPDEPVEVEPVEVEPVEVEAVEELEPVEEPEPVKVPKKRVRNKLHKATK